MKTHGHEREKRKRKETSSTQAKKKNQWRKDKGKKDREKIKRKRKNEKDKKRKSKEEKEEKNEGECVIWEKGEKKKGMTLPFSISGESAVKARRGKRQSWSTRRELRVGTRNCRFCHVPNSRGFSSTGYVLPSGHVRAILVQH